MKQKLKNFILIITLLGLNYQNALAQNTISTTGGNKWNMGGNNASGSSILGTMFAQPIFFYANSSLKMTLTPVAAKVFPSWRSFL